MPTHYTSRRNVLQALGIAAASLALNNACEKPRRQPNIVLIFTDDQGYNDLGCYGSPLIRTPHIDQMASEGMRFTNFYAQPVCGPSRAALMTGCYPPRIAEPGNIKRLHTEPHTDEITIGEIMKQAGYATACIGKWHLGNAPDQMPNRQGFDLFYGTPKYNGHTRYVHQAEFVCELMRNEKIVENPADMDMLTQKYTHESVQFIREHQSEPFFLYLSHNMPHVPLGASKNFKGNSPRGLYGDVIEELDWSAGQVLATLKELGLDDNTLVIYTSDNGPWIEEQIGEDAGSADPLRGAKMMTWEGGPRVPCIMRWPGVVPAGVTTDELAATLDFLPTFAALAGITPPKDRALDGVDISPFITGETTSSPRDVFYYYAYTYLMAVRKGPWKLVLPRPAKPKFMKWWGRMIDAVPDNQLYNMDADPEEQQNVVVAHPDVVANLLTLADKARQELGDHDRLGTGARYFDTTAPRPQKASDRHP